MIAVNATLKDNAIVCSASKCDVVCRVVNIFGPAKVNAVVR